jgi:tRNA(fMet)-specific endonuclease VapC
MTKVLLDTNTYTLFKNQKSEDALHIVDFAAEIGVPNVVMAELYSGFYSGNRFAQNVKELKDFLQLPKTRVVHFSESTPQIFGKQQAELRKRGITVPHNDLWIASLAIEFDFVVYSMDKHLKMIPSITVIQSFSDFLDL